MRRLEAIAGGLCVRRGRPFGLIAALALLLASLAGCSVSGGSGSSGINYTLGLQGSTADKPAQPPTIAHGPDGEYAFVYDNQVWAHVQGQSQAVQVTRLTLSNGASLVWGPLVWSPSGHSLAFALVQNLNPEQTTQSAGSIYYADLTKCLTASGTACPVYETGATGSVYGHGYTWLDDQWIIYGSGAGLLAYDVGDLNGWRSWQLRTVINEQQDSACGQPRAYSDVQVVSTELYYTCDNLQNMGATGAIGQASLYTLDLSSVESAFASDQYTREAQLAQIMNSDSLGSSQVASLGSVYLDARGIPLSGAWAVSGSKLVFERVTSVSPQAGSLKVTLCGSSIYSGVCGSPPVSGVSTLPLTARPQVSLGPSGSVAFQGDKLYATGLSAPVAITSPYPPQWVDASTLVATEVVSTNVDGSGVARTQTNVVAVQGGSPTVVIAGASDIAVR